MSALDYSKRQLKFDFIKIYALKKTLRKSDLNILKFHDFKAANIKWVSGNGKNAVDHIMMQSCIDVLRTRTRISQVLLINGDGDFKMLANALPNHHIAVIYQKYNYNQRLIDIVDNAISVSHFINRPGALIDIRQY